MISIEPILQQLRIGKIKPHVPLGGTLVDIGCDEPPTLLKLYQDKMQKCIGLDIVAKPRKDGNLEIKQADLQKKLPLGDRTADVITMLAVLEHMNHPLEMVTEAYRILKPNGVFLVTVPSPTNKPLLELLAILRLVRPEMIHQHQNYFTHEKLHQLFKLAGFSQVSVTSFELGFNTFVKAVKA